MKRSETMLRQRIGLAPAKPDHCKSLLRMAALAAKSDRQDASRHYHRLANRCNPDQNRET